MKFDVVISDEAYKMLGEYMQVIADKDPDAARRLTSELIEAISSLDHMPQRYPFFNETYIPQNKYHKMIVTKHFIVLYQIRDKTVYVDWIIDCRQDYIWLIR